MTIGNDFSISSGGDIRHTGGTTVYSINDFHAWLQSLADDASSTGDDDMSILRAVPSELEGKRASDKPRAMNLKGIYNIDDTAAQFLNFGSIQQSGTDVLYTGVKSIGSPLVLGSPIYIVQNGSKLTVFWPTGHIQILVKAKTGGALIDNGDIRVYSRKYGQSYSDFAVNLAAGGEQPAAISTSSTSSWTTLSLANALALSSKVSISIGDVFHDTGDGNGSKLYKGTITLSNGCTIAEAAQYCQAICDQASTTTINGTLGWKYRTLDSSYTPNSAAPFGAIAGGKWFVEQGWYISGALAVDSQSYQMVSHDGTTIKNPITTIVSVGGLVSGTRVLVVRDDGSGSYISSEYTLNGSHGSSLTAVTVRESIKSDTPVFGYIRVGGLPFSYSDFNAETKTFTLTGTLGQTFSDNTPCFVPFIDTVASSATESSANFTFNTGFTARLFARKGSVSPTKKPFETTFSITSSGGSVNAILDTDE